MKNESSSIYGLFNDVVDKSDYIMSTELLIMDDLDMTWEEVFAT